MGQAGKHLAGAAVDIILLDLGLPDAQGLAAVRWAHAIAPRIPLVVLMGLDEESLAAQALQEVSGVSAHKCSLRLGRVKSGIRGEDTAT
jgi:DNA-binding NarL/FixJ family response regulator